MKKLDQNWIRGMELVQAGGKGKVAIYSRDGLYWLRWSYRGKRYSLAVGHSQIKPTRALAAKIETDMAAGIFDATLESYRPKAAQKLDQDSDSLRGVAIRVLGVVELSERYTLHRRQEGIAGVSIAGRFQPLRNNLIRWGRQIADVDSARAFIEYLRSRQSPTSANTNLRILKAFGRWCVEQGHWQANHFEKLKPAKVERAPKRDNPFTADEVTVFSFIMGYSSNIWQTNLQKNKD